MAILVWSFNREFFFKKKGILKFEHPYFLFTATFSKFFIKSVLLRAIVARGQICRLMKTVSKIVGLKIYFCSNFFPKICVSDKKLFTVPNTFQGGAREKIPIEKCRKTNEPYLI